MFFNYDKRIHFFEMYDDVYFHKDKYHINVCFLLNHLPKYLSLIENDFIEMGTLSIKRTNGLRLRVINNKKINYIYSTDQHDRQLYEWKVQNFKSFIDNKRQKEYIHAEEFFQFVNEYLKNLPMEKVKAISYKEFGL